MERSEPAQATDPLFAPRKGKGQIKNEAECYVYKMTDLDQLQRLIFMGNGQQDQLRRIDDIMKRFLTTGQEKKVVKLIQSISTRRRNVRRETLMYAYAICCRRSNEEVKREVYSYLGKICRVPPDLFMFVKYCEETSKQEPRTGTGWGRAHKRAVSGWFTQFVNNPERLLRLVTKYKRRGGYSNKDVIRLAHVKSDNIVIKFILRYIAKGYDSAQEMLNDATRPDLGRIAELMSALEEAKHIPVGDPDRLCNLIATHRLTWEQCPTWLLKNRNVLICLLKHMPIEATVRKLGLMTSRHVFDDPDGKETLSLVLNKLKSINPKSDHHMDEVEDAALFGGTRKILHPLKLFKAMRQYKKDRAHDQEQSAKRTTLWQPIQSIADELERAFYWSFTRVQPTRKRFYFALSVNELKLKLGECEFSLNEISALMMLTLAKTEENCLIAAIGAYNVVPVDVNHDDNIDTVLKKLNKLHLPGKPDWSLPIKDALEKKIKDIDVFLFYVDCENAFSKVHVDDDLLRYRKYAANPAVKLIVCGLNASPHSLADNEDVHMLNISGFDSSVPKLIESFVRDEMHGVMHDEIPI